ncbi:PREDICTED: uncharacterized protein LOC109585048 [Amphimedon queenslandica]|uniref:Uncharacterized protein n=1 Tax=Amphimedon queenslandica TaxID=400682 RepID=A0AAN0JHM2_AMPQE|nr:PREDICTED: uncharacterized protein LOC109585048 [Amphimedon queenslandica]|eukprot:XP_019856535.1 PREDICTED: uncharacterized protein LOC109585048 [Amphimedon queenslandica]
MEGSPRHSPSPAPTTVPSDIEEKLGVFNSQVLLMILLYVNGKSQSATPTISLIGHLLKLERDSDNYSGIINYTFSRLKVNPAHSFTPDSATELPQEHADGIKLRLALVDFLLSLGNLQKASRAVKKIGGKGISLDATPLEIIDGACRRMRPWEMVGAFNKMAAEEFRHTNRYDVTIFLEKDFGGFSSLSERMGQFMMTKVSESETLSIKIKQKMVLLCQNNKRGAAFCILVPIALLILLLVGVGISMWLSYHPSNSTDQSMEIGDIQSSSALIPVPNNVSSVSLNIPSGITLFMASSIPPTGIQILQSRIPQSYGHCTPYNVNTGDNPVYLLSGSIMNYTLTVSDLDHSQCSGI